MLKSIALLLIAAIILWIEVPPLLEKKLKKELLAFLIFLSIGMGMGMVIGFGKTIPNPLDLLTFMLNPLNNVIKLVLK